MYHGHLDPRQRLTHQLSLCYSKSQRVCGNRAGGQKKTWSYSHSFVITVCQSRWTEEDLVLLSFLCHHRMSEPVDRRRLGPTLIPLSSPYVRAGGQKKTWSYSHSFVITVCQSRLGEEDLVLPSSPKNFLERGKYSKICK